MGNAMRPSQPPAVARKPHDPLHVLTHRIGGVTTHSHHRCASKYAESAGDNQGQIESIPPHATGHEGPQVFQHLELGQKPMGHPDLGDHPGLHHAIVDDTDNPTGSHGPGIFQEWTHYAEQGIPLKESVGLHVAK